MRHIWQSFRRGFERGTHPLIHVPPPYIAPDEHGDVHIWTNETGTTPAFTTDPFVRNIVIHAPTTRYPDAW